MSRPRQALPVFQCYNVEKLGMGLGTRLLKTSVLLKSDAERDFP